MMMNPKTAFKLNIFCAIVAFLLTSTVHAQNPPTTKTSPVAPQPHAPNSISKNTSDSKQLSTHTESDMGHFLNQLPGVFLQHTAPNSTSIFLRGNTGSRNSVFIDGIRTSNGLYGTVPNHYLSSISPYAVSNISATKGPSAFPLANGANTGVMNLSTPNPMSLSPGHHGSGHFLYSSGTHSPGVSVDTSFNNQTTAFYIGGDYLSFGEIRAGEGMKLPFSDYQRANWRTKIVLQPSQSPLQVTGAYIGHYSHQMGQAANLGRGTVKFYDLSDNLVYVNIEWKPQSVLSHLSIKASYHQVVEDSQRYNCIPFGGKNHIHLPSCSTLVSANNAQKTHDIIDTFGIDASSRLSFLDGRLGLEGNIEYYFDNIISSRQEARETTTGWIFLEQSRGLYSSGSYFSKFGTSIIAQSTLLKTKAGELQMKLGGRFSNFATYAPVVPGINEDIFYSNSAMTDFASLQWQKSDFFILYGQYSTGLRSPSLQETTTLGYTANHYQIPNPNLKPERTNNYEFGSSIKAKPIKFSVAWFHSRIDQYIDERPATWGGFYHQADNTPIVQFQNARRATIDGLETELQFSMANFTLVGTLSWLRGQITDEPEGYFAELVENKKQFGIRRSPKLFGSSSIRYDHPNKKFHSTVSIEWADKQTELHPMDTQDLSICAQRYRSGNLNESCQSFPGYYALHFEGAIRLFQNAELIVSLRNLTDNRYQTIGSSLLSTGFDARTALHISY